MKKTYQIPSVEMVLLKPCSIICVSPENGIIVNPGQTIPEGDGGD